MTQVALIKVALAASLLGGSLLATLPFCRYTVRDIGFVDLRGQEYVLTIAGDVDAETVKRIRAQLSETNVKLSDNTAASEAQAGLKMSLTDSSGRSLELTVPKQNAASTEDVQSSAEDRALQMVRDNVFSIALRELKSNANDSFAQLLYIEGHDQNANTNAQKIVDEAQAAIRRIEPLLPRPLALPLRTQRVPYSQRAGEQALLWSLGLDATLATENDSAPVLAIVYGRGRLAGKPLVGDRIELREALAQLALVGESCECETDRAWLQERTLPFEWDARARKSAAESLGFDPESPLVKAEVVSIVSRGPSSRPAENSRTGDGQDDIEQLLLGYEETLVAPATPSGSGTVVPAESEVPDAGVKVSLAQGSGWDFDEPTSPTPTSTTPNNTNQANTDGGSPSTASQSDGTNVAPTYPDVASSPANGREKSPPAADASAADGHDAAEEAIDRSPWLPATVTLGLVGGIVLIVILVLLRGPRN